MDCAQQPKGRPPCGDSVPRTPSHGKTSRRPRSGKTGVGWPAHVRPTSSVQIDYEQGLRALGFRHTHPADAARNSKGAKFFVLTAGERDTQRAHFCSAAHMSKYIVRLVSVWACRWPFEPAWSRRRKQTDSVMLGTLPTADCVAHEGGQRFPSGPSRFKRPPTNPNGDKTHPVVGYLRSAAETCRKSGTFPQRCANNPTTLPFVNPVRLRLPTSLSRPSPPPSPPPACFDRSRSVALRRSSGRVRSRCERFWARARAARSRRARRAGG